MNYPSNPHKYDLTDEERAERRERYMRLLPGIRGGG